MVGPSMSVSFVSDGFECELVLQDVYSDLHIAFHSVSGTTSFTKSQFSADRDGEKLGSWQILSQLKRKS